MNFDRFTPIEPDDEYTCVRCGKDIEEHQIDDEASEAFVYTCVPCAEEVRAEEAEAEAA
jgi:DNA-directed RNA polymerase subunit RPC12/RpoP